jgi:hypothetical protein
MLIIPPGFAVLPGTQTAIGEVNGVPSMSINGGPIVPIVQPSLIVEATDPMVVEQQRISALGFGVNYWTPIKLPDTALPSTGATAPAALTTGAWVTDGGGRLSTGATLDWLAGPLFTKFRTRGGAVIFDGFIASPVNARTAQFGLVNAAASQVVVVQTNFAVSTTNYVLEGLGGATTTNPASGGIGVADAQRHLFSLYCDPNIRGKLFGAIDGNEIMSYPIDASVVDQTYFAHMFSTMAADAALARWCGGICL